MFTPPTRRSIMFPTFVYIMDGTSFICATLNAHCRPSADETIQCIHRVFVSGSRLGCGFLTEHKSHKYATDTTGQDNDVEGVPMRMYLVVNQSSEQNVLSFQFECADLCLFTLTNSERI